MFVTFGRIGARSGPAAKHDGFSLKLTMNGSEATEEI
jgi:hypothetical protein